MAYFLIGARPLFEPMLTYYQLYPDELSSVIYEAKDQMFLK